MKKFKFVMLLMVLVCCVAGCGKTKPANSSQTATRTIKTTTGKVKVPKNPQRIVSTVYTGEIESLGGKVVGATSLDLSSPYLTKAQLKRIKNLGTSLNAEAVLKLKPDLIVTSNESDVKKLKKIAPVVYIPYGSTGNVYQTATKFGQILNKVTEAKRVIAKLKATAKTQTARLVKAGIDPQKTTIGMYEMQDNKLYVDGSSWGRGGEALVTAMGFKLPSSIQKIQAEAGYQQISTEALTQYSADWMFFTSYSSTKAGNASSVTDLKNNAVWKALPAVQAKQVIELPFNHLYYSDPTAVNAQMKEITTAMINAK